MTTIQSFDHSSSITRSAPYDWISSIDGLRAISILLVLVHHANTATFQNWAIGNTGVVLFFSISGFLSYLVLYRDETKRGYICYNHFLTRRILRIWPAYFTIILLAWLLATNDQKITSNNIPLFTFTVNWHQAANLTPQLSTLSILWSIAVEEQFYVFAPFIYKALRSKNWAAITFIVILIANLIRFIYIEYFAPNQFGGLYFNTLAYIDVFWMGAVAAKWFSEGRRISSLSGLLLALATLISIIIVIRIWGPIVWPPYTLLSIAPYPVLAIVSAIFVGSVTYSNNLISKLLSLPILRFIGKLSFSLYLVHVLIITILIDNFRMESGGVWFNILFFLFCIPASLILHYSIERPFLRLKDTIHSGIPYIPSIIIWTMLVLGAVNYFLATYKA